MKSSCASPAALKREYARLGRALARVGYISQGSVQQRSVATSGRSGYQWTRKIRGTTVSVALSRQQFEALKEAVANKRALCKTVQKMERISRQIIFQTCADTRRRKPLSKKLLGLN